MNGGTMMMAKARGRRSAEVKISPVSLIWMIFLILSGMEGIWAVVISVFVHEMGHVVAARLLGVRISRFELSMLGARLGICGELSYVGEVLLAAGGPFFGLLFSLTVHLLGGLFGGIFKEYCSLLSLISLCLSIFNLLPLPSMDGGRICFCALCSLFGLRLARWISRLLAFLCLFSLWLLSVYLLLRSELGLSMLVFSCIFFAKCFIFGDKSGGFMSF